ncbi:hypothetical protein SLS60_005203 [Paraconiothyrium brasiliense]|uniref:Uncharacterized protein n=1 Tax=Paraconiothyrium brasiliense TaxID=300254 RepID=A0ABR3RGP7_9PLEO
MNSEMTDTLTKLTYEIEANLEFLEWCKKKFCQKLFDKVYYFQQEHEDIDFDYEIPFPRGYEPPPKVTAVSLKVSARK